MGFSEDYQTKLQIKINDTGLKYTGSSIFAGTLKKIANHYSGRALKIAVDAGNKISQQFSQIALYWYKGYDHPFETGKLINSWEVVSEGSLQWIIRNTATNPNNASIPDMSVEYIADLEELWGKPFVKQADEQFGREATKMLNEELVKL